MKIVKIISLLCCIFTYSICFGYDPFIIYPGQSYLYIPSLEIEELIGFSEITSNKVHDTSDLFGGVQRLQNTTWGRVDAGRTVLIGHGNAAFVNLHLITTGSKIFIISSDQEIMEFEVYNVMWTTPKDVSILKQVPNAYELVLITCSSDESHRLIVQAKYLGN